MNRSLVWALAGGLVLGMGSASAGIVVPVQFTIGPTGTADVPISVTGLHPPALSAYDVNLFFAPSTLTVPNVTFGDPVYGDQLDLEGLGTFQFWQLVAPGDLHIAEVSQDSAAVLNAQQLPGFVLATVTFNGAPDTRGGLRLQVNEAGDAMGGPISAMLPQTPAPEPSTGVLTVLSLTLVACYRFRRQIAGAAARPSPQRNARSRHRQ